MGVVNNGAIFDNILVTDDLEYAKAQGEKLWRPTSEGEKEKKETWDKENKPAEDPMPQDEDEDEGDDDEGEGEEPEKDDFDIRTFQCDLFTVGAVGIARP